MPIYDKNNYLQCLALYWTVSSAYGLAQNLILMSPRVKRMCKIPHTVAELEEPYKYLLNGIKYKLKLLPNTSKE